MKNIHILPTDKPKQLLCTCERPDHYCDCLLYDEKIKNEPKQETLEEAIERLFIHYPESSGYIKAALIGAKWQQERSYSEEDMKLAFESNYESQNYGNYNLEDDFKEWFEQFKKK